MRGKTHDARDKFWRAKWHLWFAWYPKKVFLGPIVSEDYTRPWRWVWLESIECRKNDFYCSLTYDKKYPSFKWIYRIYPEQPKTDGSTGSSTTIISQEKV